MEPRQTIASHHPDQLFLVDNPVFTHTVFGAGRNPAKGWGEAHASSERLERLSPHCFDRERFSQVRLLVL